VADLETFAQCLTSIANLGANDIYNWYLASTEPSTTAARPSPPNLKINLIYPCTPKHIAKYSSQGVRTVTETPDIYRSHILPYIERNRADGRLNWVFNILDGLTEQEDVVYRSPPSNNTDDDFLLLPDLNWDRSTLTSLHLLCLPNRRDLHSLRDLRPSHLPWLRHLRASVLAATAKLYPALDFDQLKLYLHYQPTYYHLHVHVVHVALEAGATQAVGKAWGLETIMEMLEVMGEVEEATGKSGAGMEGLTMTYGVGEASELWTEVFEPLKREGQKGV